MSSIYCLLISSILVSSEALPSNAAFGVSGGVSIGIISSF